MKMDNTLYEIRTKDTDILSGVEEIKERLDDNNHIIEKKQYPFHRLFVFIAYVLSERVRQQFDFHLW